MRSKVMASLLMVSVLTASGAAFAQQRHDGAGAHGPRQPMHDASLGRPGGPIPHQDWHKGERIPAEYRDRNYEVDDWREHGLSAPPRGYHWVGVNGDYVLAAVATGVIASVLASH
ncbi:RcnB family protein [Paraburkholderia sp. J12]|uniref:RcnB family protein n=1 Tax=Paraburkholderia sp. J12 TaxID=2805432 RepID=UPI002ABD48C7|nr:RcnB family protein [Paraburkholderia sp. J12]